VASAEAIFKDAWKDVSEPELNSEDKEAALHAMPVEVALAAVDGHPTGLSETEATERLTRHGAVSN